MFNYLFCCLCADFPSRTAVLAVAAAGAELSGVAVCTPSAHFAAVVILAAYNAPVAGAAVHAERNAIGAARGKIAVLAEYASFADFVFGGADCANILAGATAQAERHTARTAYVIVTFLAELAALTQVVRSAACLAKIIAGAAAYAKRFTAGTGDVHKAARAAAAAFAQEVGGFSAPGAEVVGVGGVFGLHRGLSFRSGRRGVGVFAAGGEAENHCQRK